MALLLLRVLSMKALCSILFAGCLMSCAPQVSPQWTKADIVGLSIELIDPVAFESMTFAIDGSVPMTLGERNGPLAAPLFYWEFQSGRLRITAQDKQLYDEFRLISRNTETVTVRRQNGKVARYKIVSKDRN